MTILCESERKFKEDFYSRQGHYPDVSGLLASRSPAPSAHTKHWFIAGICRLGSQMYTLKKIIFLYGTHGSRLIQEIYSNIPSS
jgi:hypothetical protein